MNEQVATASKAIDKLDRLVGLVTDLHLTEDELGYFLPVHELFEEACHWQKGLLEQYVGKQVLGASDQLEIVPA